MSACRFLAAPRCRGDTAAWGSWGEGGGGWSYRGHGRCHFPGWVSLSGAHFPDAPSLAPHARVATGEKVKEKGLPPRGKIRLNSHQSHR